MKFQRVLRTVFAGTLAIAAAGMAQTTKTTAPAKESSTKKTVKPAAAPTEQEIADAKAKGMVWVNTSTKVYHKDGQFYGKTAHGKFMVEADALKAGYKAAQEPTAKKAKTATPSKNTTTK